MSPPERSLLARRFSRDSTLIFAGNVVAGGAVYALQVLMGRLLRVQDYSLFTALMGIFNIASLPLTALFMVVTRKLALDAAIGQPALGAGLVASAERRVALSALVVFAAAAVASPFVAHALAAGSTLTVLLVWVAVCLNAFVCFYAAVLQGRHRFTQIAIGNAAFPILRIALCAALVAVGLGVGGAMGGIALSLLAGAAWYWRLSSRVLPRHGEARATGRLFTLPEGLLLAASSLGFIALTQLDYVIVRVTCTPEQAGLYSAGAVLAKAVLWLPAGITVALYPTVVSEHAGERASQHLLAHSLRMAGAFCGALAAILAAGAGLWIPLLYGPEYAGAVPYLRWLSLVYLPLALVLVVDNYQLALGRARFVLLYFGGACAEWLAFAVPGGTPMRLVWVLAATAIVCAAWAVVVVAQVRTSQARLGT